jgi:hypothetical protein
MEYLKKLFSLALLVSSLSLYANDPAQREWEDTEDEPFSVTLFPVYQAKTDGIRPIQWEVTGKVSKSSFGKIGETKTFLVSPRCGRTALEAISQRQKLLINGDFSCVRTSLD